MSRRREFIAGLGGAATWPLAAHAQQGNRVRRIGVLMGGSPALALGGGQAAHPATRQAGSRPMWQSCRSCFVVAIDLLEEDRPDTDQRDHW